MRAAAEASMPPSLAQSLAYEHPGWLVAGAAAFAATSVVLRWGATKPAAGLPQPAPATAAALRTGWLRASVRSAAALAAVLLLVALLRQHAADWREWLLALCALAAAVLLAISCYRTAPRLPTEARLVGLVLRGLALAVLLAIIAGVQWRRPTVVWEKPLLIALLDGSRSMALPEPPAVDLPSRAQRVASAFAAARHELTWLDERFEVRRFAVGERLEPAERWDAPPVGSITALAAALDRAAQERGRTGERPAVILLVSDGAENAAGAAEVRAAAQRLAADGVALQTVGVSDGPAQVQVSWEPLAAPASTPPTRPSRGASSCRRPGRACTG